MFDKSPKYVYNQGKVRNRELYFFAYINVIFFERGNVIMATAKKTAEKETKTTKAAKAETKTEAKAETKATKITKTAKAKEAKVNVTIEFKGKNTGVNDIVEAVKAAYKADGNTDAVETIELYVQPENNVAYYVVNGKENGKCVEL